METLSERGVRCMREVGSASFDVRDGYEFGIGKNETDRMLPIRNSYLI